MTKCASRNRRRAIAKADPPALDGQRGPPANAVSELAAQAAGRAHAVHRRPARADGSRQRTHGPPAAVRRVPIADGCENRPLDDGGDARRPSAPGSVVAQRVDPRGHEPIAPQANRSRRRPERSGNGRRAPALCGQQHVPRAAHEAMRGDRRPRQPLEPLAVLRRDGRRPGAPRNALGTHFSRHRVLNGSRCERGPGLSDYGLTFFLAAPECPAESRLSVPLTVGGGCAGGKAMGVYRCD